MLFAAIQKTTKKKIMGNTPIVAEIER